MEKHQISGATIKPPSGNIVINYFKGAFAEIRKVTWPSRHETWKKAWIVIGFSIAFALFLGALDYCFNLILEIAL